MLAEASPLKKSVLASAIAGQSRIRPTGQKHRRTLLASLMLTSLVDAFSILVIFLLINYSANQDNVNVGDKIRLPEARASQFIQNGVVVRIEGETGEVFVDDKGIAISALADHLKALNGGAEKASSDGLVIVADRQLDYAALSPVILAGSSAGFTKFKFAVVRDE